jgi:hypothetical protein
MEWPSGNFFSATKTHHKFHASSGQVLLQNDGFRSYQQHGIFGKSHWEAISFPADA